ncbi:hypothetical protein IGI04_028432 [Brassica rapa subsp. trilocularis]|uniref:Uncharacterized protein n=1 Tax=Brassica rapa subsp. trilocularis TaxID=1813537 RepID=A0ABQ7L4K6_BRACM|nr:hypothetical protein IGI04_028432 [Brassica rapa subsp. trilocularis]
MNHWAVQPSALADQSVVVCPKPRRIALRNPSLYHHPARSLRCYFSHQQVEVCESEAETDILDIILTTDGNGTEQVQAQLLDSPSPFLCGSPPSRVANPLTQDARFRDELSLVSSPIPTPLGQPHSSSGRKGGCVRGSFGNSPAVRIEGFDCLDRDSRNCSIPALA